MILYNVTVSIDPAVAVEWVEWMRTKHIPDVMATGCFFPDVMATGCFLESRFSRVNGEEENGFTYATTYLAESQEKLDTYQAVFAPALKQEHSERYLGKFAAFRTFLTVIEEFK